MIYKTIKTFPDYEKFGICDQLRRASSSIAANIAEGFGRFSHKDKTHFYIQARGSLKEVQSFLLLAKELDYITRDKLIPIWELTKKSEMLLNGLIRSSRK